MTSLGERRVPFSMRTTRSGVGGDKWKAVGEALVKHELSHIIGAGNFDFAGSDRAI